ncbi:MAG: 23S rRNA (adenine(2503)-C(2))-methyltransferase RlmN [Candidatus Schekmanbacteria bacterium]|nr:23S rRNA (adenine(2503)-C(2))-methyltransferase RlmN [Candidatus Schekmanbacteria bacterium]
MAEPAIQEHSPAPPAQSTPIELRGMTAELLAAMVAELGQPRYRTDQLLHWLYKVRVDRLSAMTNLSLKLRAELGERCQVDVLALERETADAAGTRKLLWRCSDGAAIESVLMAQSDADRSTLCISSQVGCPLGCTFCLTATMGLRRHLRAAEIVEQVVLAERLSGERMQTIVFMGMGEPLANFDNVSRAIEILTDTHCAGYSPRRITVSTAGVVPGIDKLGASMLDVNLAVSLNAPLDDLRRELMPIARRYELAELVAAMRRYPLKPGQRITVEYVLLAGVNDELSLADQTARLLRGIACKINLIPLNEAEGIPFRRPGSAVVLAFQERLRAAGYHAFIRESKGREIRAACGQLATEAGAGRRVIAASMLAPGSRGD